MTCKQIGGYIYQVAPGEFPFTTTCFEKEETQKTCFLKEQITGLY